MNDAEREALLREHPEYADLIHWYPPSARRRGFWRIKPYTYRDPSLPELKNRQRLAKVAVKHYGKKGFVNGIPVIAHHVARETRKKTKTRRRGDDTLLARLERLHQLRLQTPPTTRLAVQR